MAVLSGYAGGMMPQYVIQPGSPANTGVAPVDTDIAAGVSVAVDGTPVRVVMLALAGAAGLFALKLAGFRFNVGVSS